MTIVETMGAIVLVRLFYPDFDPAHPPTPSSTALAIQFVYTIGAGVVGGWLAAYLAPRAPFGHAVALAAVSTALGLILILLVGLLEQPAWYPLVLGALSIGGILLGGKLRSSGSHLARP